VAFSNNAFAPPIVSRLVAADASPCGVERRAAQFHKDPDTSSRVCRRPMRCPLSTRNLGKFKAITSRCSSVDGPCVVGPPTLAARGASEHTRFSEFAMISRRAAFSRADIHRRMFCLYLSGHPMATGANKWKTMAVSEQRCASPGYGRAHIICCNFTNYTLAIGRK
jgi:hypothetical protein